MTDLGNTVDKKSIGGYLLHKDHSQKNVVHRKHNKHFVKSKIKMLFLN